MPAGLTNHQAIRQVKTTSGNAPLTNGVYGEKAAQTFIDGTPVQLSTGFVQAWDGSTTTNGILGICPGVANNLASNALGAPTYPYGQVQTGANLKFGSVPNQPGAINIPFGAPLVDGRQVVELAVPDNWFEAQIDNATTGTAVTAVTLVGIQYGLTVDTTGHWFVDTGKTGATAVLVIKQLNPADPIGTSFGRVWFTFLPAASQLSV